MSAEQIMTSAALYFAGAQDKAVSFVWFERARDFFAKYRLSPILFTAYGGVFLFDDCYVLADRGGDLAMFGETIQACGSELIHALQDGTIEHLSMDSPRPGAADRGDWRAEVSASPMSGDLYLGIDESFIADPVHLLCHACDMAKGLFNIRYGIAYKLPLEQEPACYAMGHPKQSVAEALEMIHHRREWDSRKKTPDELWSDELDGQRRHLAGLFRGVYPANILSEAHIQAADLRSCGIGKLSPLDSSLWLWEVSELELSVAEHYLAERDVLVAGKHKGI